jgi:hypothetical protein
MLDMLGKMKELQQRMQVAKDQLQTQRLMGSAAGGNVRVVCNGEKRVISIEIADDFYAQLSKMEVLNFIVQATNDASAQADIEMQKIYKDATGGLLPNIPGL